MRTATRLVATISLALSSFLIAGCQTGSTAMDFTLVQALPQIDLTDVAAKGDSPGDTEEFYAPLTRDGKPAGHVSGVLMIEDMPNNVTGVAGAEERLTLLNFDLPDGLIMVGGQALYPAGEQTMRPQAPAVRPVIGGTKAYLGARGEVTTTKQSDQTYLHEFHLIDVGPR